MPQAEWIQSSGPPHACMWSVDSSQHHSHEPKRVARHGTKRRVHAGRLCWASHHTPTLPTARGPTTFAWHSQPPATPLHLPDSPQIASGLRSQNACARAVHLDIDVGDVLTSAPSHLISPNTHTRAPAARRASVLRIVPAHCSCASCAGPQPRNTRGLTLLGTDLRRPFTHAAPFLTSPHGRCTFSEGRPGETAGGDGHRAVRGRLEGGSQCAASECSQSSWKRVPGVAFSSWGGPHSAT